MEDCIFCEIIKGEKPCHKVWENEEFLAFLTIFPNTEGFTVVVSKTHHPSYAFDLSDDLYCKLCLAAKTVGKLLDTKLEDVGRTALVFEGFGVNHVHAKLIPMHGTANIPKWRPLVSHIDKYFEKYEGYISTHDYVRADDKVLEKIAKKISKS